MKTRKIKSDVSWLGVVDWNRRLFDALIPLPDGTSYNAYLVRGIDKAALLDTVDPAFWDVFKKQLEDVETLDYVVSLHAEQDHSGCIPQVLAKYPAAKVVTNVKRFISIQSVMYVNNKIIHIIYKYGELPFYLSWGICFFKKNVVHLYII